ncbi:fasciclin domain-containing protein [Hymenobacter busanensis]|uniref:Fasciclin domain-containing protein n=2 Tax=Hymenobacter busanensis TaxID=2607656 RepID=A0A7L4ZW46_9BACT|nr:fasciclin domain-containing protein [Hymenobacter busanensis]QHJ07065.1 fasciclin domain-containing protein [Hymenobacter busanensis]
MFKHICTAAALAVLLTVGLAPVASAQSKMKTKDDGTTKMKGKDRPMKSGAGMSNGSMGASAGVMVGGAMMTPDKDIVANALGSSDHTTLVAAVKAADLVSTLQGPGPFTVFAPTNAAFGKLPAGTVETLVKPENKATLTKILTYHVVPGRLTAMQLKDGQTLTTVEGETLTVMKKGNSVMLRDAKGGMSTVTIPNVISSNGVTHVVDTVLMPAQ